MASARERSNASDSRAAGVRGGLTYCISVQPKTHEVTGTIEALDAAAGTFTVKGKKGNVDLKAGEKVKLGGFKVGEKVVVKYAGDTASSVKAVKAKKTTTKTETKSETKTTTTETKPAAAPAPAEKK